MYLLTHCRSCRLALHGAVVLVMSDRVSVVHEHAEIWLGWKLKLQGQLTAPLSQATTILSRSPVAQHRSRFCRVLSSTNPWTEVHLIQTQSRAFCISSGDLQITASAALSYMDTEATSVLVSLYNMYNLGCCIVKLYCFRV